MFWMIPVVFISVAVALPISTKEQEEYAKQAATPQGQECKKKAVALAESAVVFNELDRYGVERRAFDTCMKESRPGS